MPSNHLILCCSLLLPSIFPSIKVFSNELALQTRWSKYWIFSFSISPSDEYSGLISFGIDGFDLLAIHATFKSLLQHNLKPPILWCSVFFTDQLSHPYMTSEKRTLQIFVDKVMSLFFTILFLFVIAFLSTSKCLLISWQHLSLSAVTLEPRKRKFVTSSTFSPCICHEEMGPGALILAF